MTLFFGNGIRHLIENTFLHLKRWRGIATRYAKNTASFLAAVHIRCIAMWAGVSWRRYLGRGFGAWGYNSFSVSSVLSVVEIFYIRANYANFWTFFGIYRNHLKNWFLPASPANEFEIRLHRSTYSSWAASASVWPDSNSWRLLDKFSGTGTRMSIGLCKISWCKGSIHLNNGFIS